MPEASDMAVQAERPKRLFTVDEYHRMADAGIFGPEERVELLAIEAGDRFDRIVKARLYARAGILEYWVIDAGHESVDVFRTPQGDAYASFTTYGLDASLAPLAFPDLVITVRELFA